MEELGFVSAIICLLSLTSLVLVGIPVQIL